VFRERMEAASLAAVCFVKEAVRSRQRSVPLLFVIRKILAKITES
jgi:hypothetical protein